MTTLADLFSAKGSKYCDKWEQYLAVYEREMRRFIERDEPLSLLEIGVQNGGSLELWSQYLPSGTAIVGIDINSKVNSLSFENSSIRVYVADATRKDGIDWSLGSQAFDIIIDDGSHRSKDIISSFELLFDRLQPGGSYIIEDLHCSYIPEYEGGYRRDDSSIEWLKGLADVVNFDHIDPSDIAPEKYFYFKSLASSIASVTFYDSICVVEKLRIQKWRPYRRLISGERGDVEPIVESMIDTQPRYVYDTVLFGHLSLRQANATLLASRDRQLTEVRTLEERLAWVQREAHERISALTQQVERGAQALITQVEIVQKLEERLARTRQEASDRIETLTQEVARGAHALSGKSEAVETLEARLAWVRREASERIEALTHEVEQGAQTVSGQSEAMRALDERLAGVKREASERIEALTHEIEQGAKALSAALAEIAQQRALHDRLLGNEAELSARELSLEMLRKENERLRAEKEELRVALTRSCAWRS